MRHHFTALLSAIEPSQDRIALASRLPGEVREWLAEHDFETKSPHSRLIGSYSRSTAIENIKDIDVLLFLPEDQLDRTPNAVLRELKSVLDDYPDTTAEVSGQRRSVHLEFPTVGVQLDIVPAVAKDGLDCPVLIPDRPGCEWIYTDPLGFKHRISELNQDHSARVVPLVKLVKAWRNSQMKVLRPKSYVLEVMVFCAVKDGNIILTDHSTAENVAHFFEHVADKYKNLMDNGTEAPRIADPQITNLCITRGWTRTAFESFMRRIRESADAAARALEVDSIEEASIYWGKVFGDIWPTSEEAILCARKEAAAIQPGRTLVGSTGNVVSVTSAGVLSRATKFHGGS